MYRSFGGNLEFYFAHFYPSFTSFEKKLETKKTAATMTIKSYKTRVICIQWLRRSVRIVIMCYISPTLRETCIGDATTA